MIDIIPNRPLFPKAVSGVAYSQFFVVMLLCAVSSTTLAAENKAHVNTAVERFTDLYESMISSYWRPEVEINGIRTTAFDYAAMTEDARDPDSLVTRALSSLTSVKPETLIPSNQTKAFWINAYNLGAMALIVEHYPVTSITSFKINLFKHPWSMKSLHIGNRDYSLEEIEKDILLKEYGDPRIVFAVSCAAVSCPDRSPQAFRGEGLDNQIDDLIRTFFRNTDKGLVLDREQGTLTLSWILKKDAPLFVTADPAGVIGFLRSYLESSARAWLNTHVVRIRYFDHDWTLNDVALAK